MEPWLSSHLSRALNRDSPESSTFHSKTSLAQLPSLPSLDDLNHKSKLLKLGIPDEHLEDDVGSILSDLKATKNVDHSFGSAHGESYVEFDLSHMNQLEDVIKTVHISSPLKQTLKEPESAVTEVDPVNPLLNRSPSKRRHNSAASADFFSPDETGWKTMEKVTKENYYDELGNLEFERDNGFDTFNDRVRGYTKIDTEDQLNKYAELDKKTNFLFESHNKKDSTKGEKDKMDEEASSDEEFDKIDEALDSDETLAGTKGMLKDSQTFAYVGIVKLLTVEMATDLALLNQRTNTAVAKKLGASQKNFANWTMYIMSKIIDHLQISKEEGVMIEQLSRHGLQVDDLVKSLLLTDIRNAALEKAIPGFDLRWVLICDLFLLLVSDGYYDSRSRSLLFKFADQLNISSLEVRQFERRLIECLEMDTSSKTIENKDEKLRDRLFIEKHIQKNRKRRLAYVGLATLGGSLAIGLSAGLLAPVIGAGLAAGLTTVGITGTGGFLAGVGGSVAITTGGVAIGAKVGNKAGARRLGNVETFEMKPLHNNKRSNLIVTVSGWMNGEMDDVRLPFSTVDPVMGDMFSLLWEPEMLKSMGQTIGILASEALSTSIQQILGATLLTALMSAIQLPMALSKLSYLLDNPWNVSLDRAWKAGKILADTLISGNLGVRPVTLVGFSLGSRLIYSCLIELAARGGFGLIENVILLGNPMSVKYEQITLARSVVSGRFVNGYIRNDWILGYLFRATGGGLQSVAGISPIENIPGVENFDCTEFVDGHMSYRKAIPSILKALDWEVLSEEFSEIEEPDIEQRERQRRLLSEFEEARAKMEQEREQEMVKEKSWKSWFRPKQKNWWDVIDEKPKETDDERRGAAPAAEFEEYNVQTTGTQRTHEETKPDSVFDVGALMQEVKDIEKLGAEISHEPPAEAKKGDSEHS
ncbi:hypothetical protein PUMCH_004008 [Australozyma saopauloensis]|uniref:DUF726-domain-containing protein n=1 Tax=Australozyma saopauloensis TaxID=291208 RepID=A0AAX4HDY8_9ASCO|nr:hypothetical protein PUMCH_004008 [[Candida] saopauloensis]